jgi:histone deacetylase complex regulatory component SIN3
MKVRFILLLIWALLLVLSAQAQHAFQRSKARHFKDKYRKQLSYYADACDLLRKNRNHLPSRNFSSQASKMKYKPMAEFDLPGTIRTAHVPNPVQQSTYFESVVPDADWETKCCGGSGTG